MTQTERILRNQLQLVADNLKLKIDQESFIETKDGQRKYKPAKPFSVCIKWADARCGNKVTVALNLPKGRIITLTDYLTPYKLLLGLQEQEENFKKEVVKYKQMYKK